MISAGNTKIPSYLTLLSKGYEVKLKMNGEIHKWNASKASASHYADDLDSLLGVVTLFEERGVDFLPSKKEISDFFQTFPELKNAKKS